jgi:hypothetical protein
MGIYSKKTGLDNDRGRLQHHCPPTAWVIHRHHFRPPIRSSSMGRIYGPSRQLLWRLCSAPATPDYDTIHCTMSSELERVTSAHATRNPWLWSTSWEDVQDWKPSGGRFGLRELAHTTSYMETNNSSEDNRLYRQIRSDCLVNEKKKKKDSLRTDGDFCYQYKGRTQKLQQKTVEIYWHDHSLESACRNILTWPFIGKCLRSTFWWYH